MKYKIKFMLLLFATSTVFFSACNKTELVEPAQTTVNDPTAQKILNFKAKLADASKSDETLTLDSAVWYIEAALNYSYCNTERDLSDVADFAYDTLTVCASEQAQNLNLQTVVEIYDAFAERTSELLNSTQQKLMFQDVTIAEGEFQLITTLALIQTEKGSIVTSNFTEPWKWGLKSGKCDGTYYNKSDAALQIASKARMRISVIYGYYTDVTTISWVNTSDYDLDDPNTTDRNYCDYYMFDEDKYQSSGIPYFPEESYSQCVSVTEMNYYLNKVPTVASIVKSSHSFLHNHDFIGISMNGDAAYSYEGSYWLRHFADITYGIPHASNPPIEQ